MVTRSVLEEVHGRVFYQRAPKGTDPGPEPYIVFHVLNSGQFYAREDFTVTVEVWAAETVDSGPVLGEVLELMEQVDQRLNRLSVVLDNIGITYRRENQTPVPDPDPNVCRYDLTYSARVYQVKEG